MKGIFFFGECDSERVVPGTGGLPPFCAIMILFQNIVIDNSIKINRDFLAFIIYCSGHKGIQAISNQSCPFDSTVYCVKIINKFCFEYMTPTVGTSLLVKHKCILQKYNIIKMYF
jgi:hypothetical protein